MKHDFTGKIGIVTGGANGIGLSIAMELLAAGSIVIVIDKDAEVCSAISKTNSKIAAYIGDLSSQKFLDDFISELDHPIDFLINNAAISKAGILSDCSYSDFEQVLKVNLVAPYYLTCSLFNKNMLNAGAAIVNISSTRAKMSQKDTESYSASKGGILSLTHAMAASIAPHRVNAISPGWINTAAGEFSPADHSQHNTGRIGTTKDIASMVLYLLDNDKSSFITGQNFTIDGGISKRMIYHNDEGWSYKI